MKPKIFIACDTTNQKKIKKIIKESKNTKVKFGYKFGLEFLNSKHGRKFVANLKNKSEVDFSQITSNNFKKLFNINI